jgi:MFS family permease
MLSSLLLTSSVVSCFWLVCCLKFVSSDFSVFTCVFRAWKCMIGESCDPLTQGQVMSYMSLAWGLGCIAGPSIGGLLSQPCNSWPEMVGCSDGGLFRARWVWCHTADAVPRGLYVQRPTCRLVVGAWAAVRGLLSQPCNSWQGHGGVQ